MIFDNSPVRYRKPNREWAKLPFQANGAGIAIYTTVITSLVSAKAIEANSVAILPAAIYFAGLVFAYRVQITNVNLDGDIENRERLDDAMTFVLEKEGIPGLPEVKKVELAALAKHVIQERKKTFSPEKIKVLTNNAARNYLYAMTSFLVSTLTLFVYFPIFWPSARARRTKVV